MYSVDGMEPSVDEPHAASSNSTGIAIDGLSFVWETVSFGLSDRD